MNRAVFPLAVVFVAGFGCSRTPVAFDPGLEGLQVTAVSPDLVIPGSVLVVEGRSFVGDPWGVSRLRLEGMAGGETISVAAPAVFVDFVRMEVRVDQDLVDALGGDVAFVGTATLEVDSSVDGKTHRAPGLAVELEVRRELEPALDSVASDSLIFVNDEIEIGGSGLLLTESEGVSYASVTGCFRPVGSDDCERIDAVEVPVAPANAFARDAGTFAFRPGIAGISPGTFEGEIAIRNQLAAGASLSSSTRPVRYELIESTVFSVAPKEVSLGQYVEIRGGGFLGGEGGGLTLLELKGSFRIEGAPDPVPLDPPLVLVPEFIDGRTVRYVLNEDDALGQALDLRRVSGSFTGQVDVLTSYEGLDVPGRGGVFNLALAPVKQVVYLIFRPSYVESLRHFGLRAVDRNIRERIIDVVQRDYRTINLEVRTEPPEDFSLYMEVEIGGPDPNSLGLLGYDNTPGKDTGNERLFDRIGGVNATTQADGYPGYGGVFIESMFAFSRHPGPYADSVAQADGLFDSIFDTFRPDRGRAAAAKDLAGGFEVLASGAGCPALDRKLQLGCAVWALGGLIGTTLSHEMGHSLGLANPFGEGFHNFADAPNRLMDSGGNRPFAERAELNGQGPAVFCKDEYDYLRQILPTDEPPDSVKRPSCF